MLATAPHSATAGTLTKTGTFTDTATGTFKDNGTGIITDTSTGPLNGTGTSGGFPCLQQFNTHVCYTALLLVLVLVLFLVLL